MTSARHVTLLALTTLFLAAFSPSLKAQGRSIPKGSEASAKEELLSEILPEGQKYRYPFFNGLNLSVDLFDPVLHLFAIDHCSYEVQLMADLHHRFFPMVSVGLGMANETSNNGLEFGTDQKQECNFKSDLSPFAKVGMAYNLDYNSLSPDDFYMVFLRYGIGHQEADITNLYFANDHWGALGPISITDQKYTTHWIEVGAMVKVQIYKRFSLGWDLYWKIKLAQSGTEFSQPYYVPGMGTTQSGIGCSFRLYYDLF